MTESILGAPPLLRLQLPTYERVRLTLVGCGGTGSHIASGLVAIAQALEARGQGCELLFIDPDRVEPKNIGRQLFSIADLGQPKAAVLAGRLSAAFRLTIGSHVRAVNESDGPVIHEHGALSVVVGAVDNHAARQTLATLVGRAFGTLWWLDTGNSEQAGQVFLGNATRVENLKQAVGLGLVDRLPAPSVAYPDLLAAPTLKPTNRHKRPSKDPSCAELVAAGEQGLMVNRMAAAWALALLHDFLLGEVTYFGLAFDLKYAGTKRYALDLPTLAEVTGLAPEALEAKGKQP
jgi:PRTRC genetic system ThiF family protein